MRILVDQSGYALLNIGDIAMLQACILRLQSLWPDADIQVLTDSPERLEQYCPRLTGVAPSVIRRLTSSTAALPYRPAQEMRSSAIPSSARLKHRFNCDIQPNWEPSRMRAIRRADVVICSGGGFINDIFWRHAARVLSFLAIAQRFGKPTAMFSQGIGPLTHPLLTRLSTYTMPRLLMIGLREELGSAPILRSCRVDPERIRITGDDALLLATGVARPPTGTAVGLNIRVAFYSSIDKTVAGQTVAAASEFASRRSVPTLALPVSRYKGSADLEAMNPGGTQDAHIVADDNSDDIRNPEELAERAARCRVIVTGSYHAAIFGLAAGVPAVCITNSIYYDLKFKGLSMQFPGGCHIVRPGLGFERDLSDAIERAWDISESDRDRLHSVAQAQVAQADQAYRWFGSLVAGARS
ncbi:polysaccharide pyruvyl transferase family protein [Mycobacterium paraffinicum]|nr:polysaccharide pyruvyl transferase family protein [Mycobacterium paraffinicum]MCV7313725.1 polysaccharide pyruvyl transferase family protein [Mycobacterium paraffinicum]